jgi:hypothetical protein
MTETDLQPELPENGDQPTRGVILGFVAFVTVLGTLGTALSPWLLVRYPLVLVALSPDVRHLVLVAAHCDFLPVLLIGGVRRAAGLIAMYGIGRLYGPMALDWFERQVPRLGGPLRWLERLFGRVGALLLIFFPVYTVGGLAGAAGTRLKAFVPAMLLGQALYISAAYYFGDAIRLWTLPLLEFLTEHVVGATLVCLGLVVGQRLWSRRSSSESPGSE